MRARDNPFSTDRVHRIRYEFDGLTWASFLDRLEGMNYRGAIVGPEGSGKTTLLEDLERQLEQRGFSVTFLRLTQECSRFSRTRLGTLAKELSLQTILLLDGAEQMSRWSWWNFRWQTRRAGGLIVSAHREGLLPTLLMCRTDTALLARIIRELLGEGAEIREPDVENLYRRNHGNLRNALREIYDQYSHQGPGSRMSAKKKALVSGSCMGTSPW